MSIEEKTDFQIELEIEVENSALISSLGLFNSRLKQAYVSKILDENSSKKIFELTNEIKNILNKK
jgi:hypothetical protein